LFEPVAGLHQVVDVLIDKVADGLLGSHCDGILGLARTGSGDA
jgi:hypothetical protein